MYALLIPTLRRGCFHSCFFRRAAPGQCHYDPLPVRVKSKLIQLKPKGSEWAGYVIISQSVFCDCNVFNPFAPEYQ